MNHALPTDTHHQRLHALDRLPWLLNETLTGNPYYAQVYTHTLIGLTFWAATPWRWNT